MTFNAFFEHLGDLDWVAVIVATLALAVLGAIWYGPLFGKAWAVASGQPYTGGMPDTGKIVQTVVSFFVLNVGLAYTFIFDDLEHAIVFGGIVIGVLIIGPVVYGGTVWEGRSTRAFLIDLLFWFVGLSLAFYVQGLIA